jgi:phosphate transport system protein
MREAFDQELQRIRLGLTEMLAGVRETLRLSQQMLVDRQPVALSQITALDRLTDARQDRIEEVCLRAIALHQPVAGDLRFLAAVLKSLTDVERMGDYAVHVAEDAETLNAQPALKPYVSLNQMISDLDGMLAGLDFAIKGQDLAAARRVHAADAAIDEFYEQLQRELVTYMLEDLRTIGRAMLLIRVARSLERIGDHIENVAERLIFWISGERLTRSPAAEG